MRAEEELDIPKEEAWLEPGAPPDIICRRVAENRPGEGQSAAQTVDFPSRQFCACTRTWERARTWRAGLLFEQAHNIETRFFFAERFG